MRYIKLIYRNDRVGCTEQRNSSIDINVEIVLLLERRKTSIVCRQLEKQDRKREKGVWADDRLEVIAGTTVHPGASAGSLVSI